MKKLILALVLLVGSMAAWCQIQVAAPDTLSSDDVSAFLSKNPQARVVSAGEGNIVVRLRKEIFYNIRMSDNGAHDAVTILHQVGAFMHQFPDSKIHATGYADRGTGNYQLNQMYAGRRAAQFRSDLIQQYGIAPERITSDSNGDVVQPFYDNDRNRCVIVTGLGYLAVEPSLVRRRTAQTQAETQRVQYQQERDQRYATERQRHSERDTIVISHVDTLWLGTIPDSLQADTLKPERPFCCNRRHWWRNWFLSLSGGPSIFQGDHNIDAEWIDRIYPAFSLKMGKWIVPAVGLQVGIDMDMIHSYYNANPNNPNPLANKDGVVYYGEFVHGASPDKPYEKHPWLYRMDYVAWNYHADLMINFTSLMWRPYNRRFWNLIGYAGVGCIATWDNGEHDWFNYATSWNVGLLNTFRMGERVDLNIDLRVKKFSDDFNCFRQGRDMDGITNLMVGLTWHFTKRGF